MSDNDQAIVVNGEMVRAGGVGVKTLPLPIYSSFNCK